MRNSTRKKNQNNTILMQRTSSSFDAVAVYAIIPIEIKISKTPDEHATETNARNVRELYERSTKEII